MPLWLCGLLAASQIALAVAGLFLHRASWRRLLLLAVMAQGAALPLLCAAYGRGQPDGLAAALLLILTLPLLATLALRRPVRDDEQEVAE